MRYIVLYSLIICSCFCASLEAQKPAISLLPHDHQLLQEILNDTSTRPDTVVMTPASPAPDPIEKAKEEKKEDQKDGSIRKSRDRKKVIGMLSGLHPLRSRKYNIGFFLITALNI